MTEKDIINYSSGGGGSNLEFISYEQWNAMTTEQKQAKDYVLVGDAYGKYTLINGKEYVEQKEIGYYLPYSNADNIITDAYVENFDHDEPFNKWGYGSSPVIFGTFDGSTKNWYRYDEQEDAIYLGAQEAGQQVRFTAKMDFGHSITPSQPFTAYLIAKITTPRPSYPIPMGCYYGTSSWGGQALFYMVNGSSQLEINNGSSGAGIVLNSFPYNEYIGYCLQYNPSTKMGRGCVMSPTVNLTQMFSPTYTTNYVNSYISLCAIHASYMDQSSNVDADYRCNLLVKYFGVVNTLESESVVQNNMENLKQQFLVSE